MTDRLLRLISIDYRQVPKAASIGIVPTCGRLNRLFDVVRLADTTHAK